MMTNDRVIDSLLLSYFNTEFKTDDELARNAVDGMFLDMKNALLDYFKEERPDITETEMLGTYFAIGMRFVKHARELDIKERGGTFLQSKGNA